MSENKRRWDPLGDVCFTHPLPPGPGFEIFMVRAVLLVRGQVIECNLNGEVLGPNFSGGSVKPMLGLPPLFFHAFLEAEIY